MSAIYTSLHFCQLHPPCFWEHGLIMPDLVWGLIGHNFSFLCFLFPNELGWGHLQTVERSLGVLGGEQQNEWPECCCSRASHQDTGLHQPGHHQQSQSSHCPSQSLTGHAWNTVLIPAIQKKNRCGQVGKGPEKSHKDDPKPGKLPHEQALDQRLRTGCFNSWRENLGETSWPGCSVFGNSYSSQNAVMDMWGSGLQSSLHMTQLKLPFSAWAQHPSGVRRFTTKLHTLLAVLLITLIWKILIRILA